MKKRHIWERLSMHESKCRKCGAVVRYVIMYGKVHDKLYNEQSILNEPMPECEVAHNLNGEAT